MVLANSALRQAARRGFVVIRPPGLTDVGAQVESQVGHRPKNRLRFTTTAPSQAFETAVGVGAALAILKAPNLNVAAERAGWLVDVGDKVISTHMVAEYARHCGHADLIRERVDGMSNAECLCRGR